MCIGLTRQRPSAIPLSRTNASTSGVMLRYARRSGTSNKSSLRACFTSKASPISSGAAAGCNWRPRRKETNMASVATTDVTVAAVDEMDSIHGGIARRARAQLGVTAWGMQVLTLPPNWKGYPSAREAAETLDMTAAATNSALQRARERVDRERGAAALARTHRPADGRTEETLMRRFVEAWEAVDVEGMTALLAGDALMTMPPEPMHVVGPVEIAGFFATVPMDGRLDLIRLVPTRANGQPTLAAYVQETPAEPFRAYGLMVFALDGDRIAGITGFARYPELFPVFELPVEI